MDRKDTPPPLWAVLAWIALGVVLASVAVANAVTICMTMTAADATRVSDAYAVNHNYDGADPLPCLTLPTPCPTVSKSTFAQHYIILQALREVAAAQDLAARATATALIATTPTPSIN